MSEDRQDWRFSADGGGITGLAHDGTAIKVWVNSADKRLLIDIASPICSIDLSLVDAQELAEILASKIEELRRVSGTPEKSQTEKFEVIRDKAEELSDLIVDMCPAGDKRLMTLITIDSVVCDARNSMASDEIPEEAE